MPENAPDRHTPSHPPMATNGLPVRDLKTIGDGVMDLNIARKNLLIYPSSHEQVQRSVNRAFGRLQDALALLSPLTLTVIKGQLCAGPNLSAIQGAFAGEMSLALKERGVVALSLFGDISRKELMTVLMLLTISPEKLKAKGGILSVAGAAGVSHAVFKEVDYSRLHLTEEQEIRRDDAVGDSEDTWRLFVSHLVDTPHAAAATDLPDGANLFDPTVVAGLLNEKQADGRKALAYYKALTGAFMAQADSGTPSPEAFSTGLDRFHRLIKELKPPLRQQFLSVALDQISVDPPSHGAQGLIGGMGTELVVEMLRQANASGQPISPSLVAFIKKMGVADASEMLSQITGDNLRQVQSSMKVLLEAEDYASYVDEKYHNLLNALTVKSSDGRSGALSDFDQRLAADLDEVHIVSHTARALLGLMATSRDVEAYRDWARPLTFILDDLLALHAFGPLARIFDVVSRLRARYGDDDRGKITSLIIDRFNASAFISDLMTTMCRRQEGITPHGAALLDRLGEAVAVEAVERWAADDNRGPEAPLYQVLTRCRPHAVREAIDRLNDSRPASVCAMLEIVGEFGNAGEAERVKPLLEHPHQQVRLVALDTMLRFGNPWSLLRLREMLAAPWCDEVAHAFYLAGKHRIREMVQQLLDIAGRPDPLGKDIRRRKRALLALGQIGDPRAIPLLTKLSRRRWSITRRHMRRFKQVLFESLEGYPLDAVQALLHDGLQQKDRKIVQICEELLKQHHRIRQDTPSLKHD